MVVFPHDRKTPRCFWQRGVSFRLSCAGPSACAILLSAGRSRRPPHPGRLRQPHRSSAQNYGITGRPRNNPCVTPVPASHGSRGATGTPATRSSPAAKHHAPRTRRPPETSPLDGNRNHPDAPASAGHRRRPFVPFTAAFPSGPYPDTEFPPRRSAPGSGERRNRDPLHPETATGIEGHLSETGIARPDLQLPETGGTRLRNGMTQQGAPYALPLQSRFDGDIHHLRGKGAGVEQHIFAHHAPGQERTVTTPPADVVGNGQRRLVGRQQQFARHMPPGHMLDMQRRKQLHPIRFITTSVRQTQCSRPCGRRRPEAAKPRPAHTVSRGSRRPLRHRPPRACGGSPGDRPRR